jgi:hypothetical protein
MVWTCGDVMCTSELVGLEQMRSFLDTALQRALVCTQTEARHVEAELSGRLVEVSGDLARVERLVAQSQGAVRGLAAQLHEQQSRNVELVRSLEAAEANMNPVRNMAAHMSCSALLTTHLSSGCVHGATSGAAHALPRGALEAAGEAAPSISPGCTAAACRCGTQSPCTKCSPAHVRSASAVRERELQETIHSKDVQVRHFRDQVDSLIKALETLRKRPAARA